MLLTELVWYAQRVNAPLRPPPRYPTVPTVSVTIGGKIGGVAPWDCTLWFGGADPLLDVQACVAGMAVSFPAAIDPFGNEFAQLNDTSTTLQQATIRGYTPGSSAAVVQVTAVPGSPIVGATAPGGPASQAFVTTLNTKYPGRSGRGRLYWPATALLQGDHGYTLVQAQNLAQVTRNLYTALSDSSGQLAGGPVVGVVRSLTMGATHTIVAISTNTQPDRQEHRERHLTFQRVQLNF